MGGPRRIPFVAIVGRKKIGKTSLIEKLLPLLKEEGYRVGVLKYDVREFQMDYPGKDTYRSYQAGADSVLISSSEKLAFIKGLDSTPSLKGLIRKYFSDTDLVLIEGYKEHDCPEIHILEPSEAANWRPEIDCPFILIKKEAPEEVSSAHVRAALDFIRRILKKDV
jgi:molybdopterin-guanine dinucleotide biosynthesis protein MobB